MPPVVTPSAARPRPTALLPWLYAMACRQWAAWQDARQAVHADEQRWHGTLQEARRMAAQSRAMAEVARQR